MAFPARLACILMLVLLDACATSEKTEVSSPDVEAAEAYDERLGEMDRTFEELRVAANACSTLDIPCWEDVLEGPGSGFEQAVSEVQDTVRSLAPSFDAGECRSSVAAFDASLEDLLDSLDALRVDVEGNASLGIESSSPAVRSAMEAAATAGGSFAACWAGVLEPGTDG